MGEKVVVPGKFRCQQIRYKTWQPNGSDHFSLTLERKSLPIVSVRALVSQTSETLEGPKHMKNNKSKQSAPEKLPI